MPNQEQVALDDKFWSATKSCIKKKLHYMIWEEQHEDLLDLSATVMHGVSEVKELTYAHSELIEGREKK